MVGGLILYFEGLQSLEKCMSETSAGEVFGLRDKLLAELSIVEASTSTLKRFVFSQERITGYNSSEWSHLIRTFQYAQVASADVLYSSAIALVAHDTTNRSAFYVAVWGDVLHNGTRQLVFGTYNDELPPDKFTVSEDGRSVESMLVPTYTIGQETGYIRDPVYEWDGKQTYILNMQDYNPRDGPNKQIPGGGLWAEKPVAGSVMTRWNKPHQWYASDGHLYTYTEMEAVYVPPPAPHPWSSYKAVLLYVGFLYRSLQPPFDEYRLRRPDTTAMLVDRTTGVVYASTSGGIVPSWCQAAVRRSNDPSVLECSLTVANFSLAVQEGFLALADVAEGDFVAERLDGEDYFMRKTDSGHFSLELLWMRPVSSVQSEVKSALTLLVIFTALVLVFDVTISIFEVVFIALPMRHLSRAICAVGEMEIQSAAHSVERYNSQALMVTEVRHLMAGMNNTIRRLEEFRTFMPEAILRGNDDEEDDTSDRIRKQGSRESDVMSEARRCSDNGSETSASSSQVHFSGGVTSLFLQGRQVGLLAANVVGWWSEVEGGTPELLLHSHTDLVTNVAETCAIHGGVVDSFHGDRFLVGWNTVKDRSDYAQRAASSAFALITSLKKWRLSTAVTAGKAKVGNTGSKSMRRATIISPLLPWLADLESYNKEMGFQCTTDEQTVLRCPDMFDYRIVDALACHKTQVVVPIVRLLKRIYVLPVGEWMYQLGELEDCDRFSAEVNAFAKLVISENWALIQDVPVQAEISPQLLKAWNERSYTPLERRFDRCARQSVTNYRASTGVMSASVSAISWPALASSSQMSPNSLEGSQPQQGQQQCPPAQLSGEWAKGM